MLPRAHRTATSPRRCLSRWMVPLAVTVTVLGLAAPAQAAVDLLVAAVDFDRGVAIFPYSFADGYGDPVVPFGSLVIEADSIRADHAGIAAGGFGCATYVGNGPAVFECHSGQCTGPRMGSAAGGYRSELLAADDRDVWAFEAPPGNLFAERYTVATGQRAQYSIPTFQTALGVSAEFQLIAAYRNGANWDIVLVKRENGQESGHVVRITRNGGLVNDYALPGGRIPAAADYLGSGEVLILEEAGSDDRLGRYRATNYQRLGDRVAAGDVSASRAAVAITGSRVLSYRNFLDVGIWNRNTGADLGTLPKPPGTNLIRDVMAPSCMLDTTRGRIGPGKVIELQGTVRDQQGTVLPIRFAPNTSSESVEAYFFDAGNREMLIKVLDACGFTGTYWVFVAAATDLQFNLTVTNRTTGQSEDFVNPPNTPASSINETLLFPCT